MCQVHCGRPHPYMLFKWNIISIHLFDFALTVTSWTIIIIIIMYYFTKAPKGSAFAQKHTLKARLSLTIPMGLIECMFYTLSTLIGIATMFQWPLQTVRTHHLQQRATFIDGIQRDFLGLVGLLGAIHAQVVLFVKNVKYFRKLAWWS